MRPNETPLVRLVDDEADVRDSVSLFLQMADFETAAYASAAAFLAEDDGKRPGCLILDVRMPEMTGLQLQEELVKRHSDIPIIFLSAHGDIEMAMEAVHRGAADFLVKPPKPEKLLEVVKKVTAAHVLKRRKDEEQQELLTAWQSLTAAEQQVAFLVAKGLTNTEAAGVLAVAERTVRAHRAQVYAKLGVANAVETLAFLQAAGLVTAEGL